MSAFELPPPVDIKPEAKKTIIAGLKEALGIYQQQGLAEHSISYSDLIHDPAVLYAFIQVYRAHPEHLDGLIKSKDGKPVRDFHTALACETTLSQIEHLLVMTCARYWYDQRRVADKVVTTEREVRHMLFFKKTERVETIVKGDDPRKHQYLMEYLAYDWQLPLLEAYDALAPHHYLEFGAYLLALRSPAAIAAVAAMDRDQVKKVRALMKDDIAEAVSVRPMALVGAVGFSPEMYAFVRKILKDKAWYLFAREAAFLNALGTVEKSRFKVFGDTLCYIAAENVLEFERLDLDRTDVVLRGIKGALGNKAPVAFALPNFGKDMLRKLVDSVSQMKGEKDKIAPAAELTCQAMAGDMLDWLNREIAALRAPRTAPKPADEAQSEQSP